MKKSISVLLVVFATAISWSQITNPGFEAGNTGWTMSNMNSSTESWGVPVPVGDRYAGDAANNATKTGYMYQIVSVTPGNTYKLRALCTNWDQYNVDLWVDSGQFRIGLDPSGSAQSGGGSACAWSSNFRWARYETPRVTATGSTMTVWAEYNFRYGVTWQFAYFDDFELLENPPLQQNITFEGEAYPGPFYSSFFGNNVKGQGLMVIRTAQGADGTTNNLRVSPRGTDQEDMRAIATFLMEGPGDTAGTGVGWMRNPLPATVADTHHHWMEIGWRTGSRQALNFDNQPENWTLMNGSGGPVAKYDGFDSTGYVQGNANTWTRFEDETVLTNSAGQVTLGVKLGKSWAEQTGFTSLNFHFDELSIHWDLPVNDWMLYSK